MKISHTMLAKLLTYTGALPFIACLILIKIPLINVDTSYIFRTYGAVIIAFLCGIHWAVYIFFSERCAGNLFITSNLFALVAWVSLIAPPGKIYLLLQPLSFLALLVVDIKLYYAKLLPKWFFYLRRNATLMVVTCQFLMMIFSS